MDATFVQEILTVGGVPIITGVVFAILAWYKNFAESKGESYLSRIPTMSAVLGIIIGIALFYLLPDVMPVDNILAAIFVGACSGLAATGIHQIGKQKTKLSEKTSKVNEQTNKFIG